MWMLQTAQTILLLVKKSEPKEVAIKEQPFLPPQPNHKQGGGAWHETAILPAE